MRFSILFVATCLLLNSAILIQAGYAAEPSEITETQAIQIIRSLGGRFGYAKSGSKKKIDSVSFTNNKITDTQIKFINHLKDIRKLGFYNVKISGSGLQSLTNLKHLQNLEFQNCPLEDDAFQHLKQFPALTHLFVRHVPLTDQCLVHLKDLTQLEVLWLFATQISDSGLEHLNNLKELNSLNLYQTKISNAGLTHLSELKKLKQLEVNETKVTSAGVTKLQEALPECKILFDRPVLPAHLKVARQVKSLGGFVRYHDLDQHRLLSSISLSRPHIDDKSLACLKGLSGLKSLTLNQTSVSDQGLQILNELKGLTSLTIMQSPITFNLVKPRQDSRHRRRHGTHHQTEAAEKAEPDLYRRHLSGNCPSPRGTAQMQN